MKSNDDYSEYIDDSGKLRPLPKDEQVALIQALKAIGNTEMTLAFFLALATGARLHTAFGQVDTRFPKKKLSAVTPAHSIYCSRHYVTPTVPIFLTTLAQTVSGLQK